MSEQQIVKWAEMSPGQRDKLVAETIGWQSSPCHPEPYQVVLNLDGYRCYKCGKHAPVEAGFYDHTEEIPRFTTSMDAAWLIMDHLKPGRVGLHVVEDHEAFLRRALFVDQLDNHMNSWWSWTRERLCEAICLAALRVCGVEIDMSEKAGE